MTSARVLVLGGVDPTGGAGITADARVLAAHGAFALPIALALTVQNRRGLTAVHPVPLRQWRAAAAAALADGPVHAVKTGLLADRAQIEAVVDLLATLPRGLPVVVDPVLSATAGGYRATAAVVAAYRQRLVPRALVFTPNLPEWHAMFGDAPLAVATRLGCRAVLRKGGHGDGERLVDELHTASADHRFAHRRLPVGAVHGTGCALASAIAAGLAARRPLADTVGTAIRWLQRCLRRMGPPAGDGLPRPLLVLPQRNIAASSSR